MKDILFETATHFFSYRVAGILKKEGKILLHKALNEEGFAFPGGHVSFGESNEACLIREFKEELNVDIEVIGLKWVAEIFFPMRNKPCHQICLYYDVRLKDSEHIPTNIFYGRENFEGTQFEIEFHWLPIHVLSHYLIYPPQAKALLADESDEVKHFIYRE